MDKLDDERPGILNRLVAGCLAWQERDRLDTPDAVTAEIGRYRTDMDSLGQFLADRCTLGTGSAKAKNINGAYLSYCEDHGHAPRTPTAIGRRLAQEGCTKRRSNGIVWDGITLNSHLE